MNVYCDDWACPAKASCRHAFWRSREYAAMKGGRTEKRPRDPQQDACAVYEFDTPKKWLQ